jgi:nitrate/nitrite transporter NarK
LGRQLVVKLDERTMRLSVMVMAPEFRGERVLERLAYLLVLPSIRVAQGEEWTKYLVMRVPGSFSIRMRVR